MASDEIKRSKNLTSFSLSRYYFCLPMSWLHFQAGFSQAVAKLFKCSFNFVSYQIRHSEKKVNFFFPIVPTTLSQQFKPKTQGRLLKWSGLVYKPVPEPNIVSKERNVLNVPAQITCPGLEVSNEVYCTLTAWLKLGLRVVLHRKVIHCYQKDA